MYKNRHCAPLDYQKIKKEIDHFYFSLSKEDNLSKEECDSLYKEISDFDIDIASRFLQIISLNDDKKIIKDKCQIIFDELLKNIIVDINEHN
ncbi:MAG: hypothetical protein J6M95_00780 [Bacilli bacterium]|nr:hypothetical protein [Bacilli bacterium]